MGVNNRIYVGEAPKRHLKTYLGLTYRLTIPVHTLSLVKVSPPGPEGFPAFALLALQTTKAEEDENGYHQRNGADNIEAVRYGLGRRNILNVSEFCRQR